MFYITFINLILRLMWGRVSVLKDGIATVTGMKEVKAGEVVFFLPQEIHPTDDLGESCVRGLVLSLNFNSTFIIILGNETLLRAGTVVFRSFFLFNVNTSLQMFGRVIDALAQSKDSLTSTLPFFGIERCSYIERKAAGIVERVPVNNPLRTGVKAVDSLIPIGRGQRELIIGDRQTGKTSVAIDTILNYSTPNNNLLLFTEKLTINDLRKVVWFVYVAIGQKQSSVSQVFNTLKSHNSAWFTSIVAATAAESVPLQFLAPYTGCTLGEFIRDTLGGHCLIIYDDLSKHAVAYRQMSLLLRRPPGREAFPGDVFYVHSRLLERAGALRDVTYDHRYFFKKIPMIKSKVKVASLPLKKFQINFPRGTLTAFPIIETQAGDVSAYIPTNVISITDGQIFLESELFYKGVRPAINVGLSVSRVGSAAQSPLARKVVGSLKIDLAQFREIEGFAKLGASLDEHTHRLLLKGENLIEILKQKLNAPLSLNDQNLSIFLGVGYSPAWLNAILKLSFFKSNSFISRSRIRTSWFELIRLHTAGFSLINLSELLLRFLDFIKRVGVADAFKFHSTEFITSKIVDRFPVFFFDDLFIAFLCEQSDVIIKYSESAHLLTLKWLKNAKNSKLSICKVTKNHTFFTEKKLRFTSLIFSGLQSLRMLSESENLNIDFISTSQLSVKLTSLYLHVFTKYLVRASSDLNLKFNFPTLSRLLGLQSTLFAPFLNESKLLAVLLSEDVYNKFKFKSLKFANDGFTFYINNCINFYNVFSTTLPLTTIKLLHTNFLKYFKNEKHIKESLNTVLRCTFIFTDKARRFNSFIYTAITFNKLASLYRFEDLRFEFQKFFLLYSLTNTSFFRCKNSKFSTLEVFEIIPTLNKNTVKQFLFFQDNLSLFYKTGIKFWALKDLKHFFTFMQKLSVTKAKTAKSAGLGFACLFFKSIVKSKNVIIANFKNIFLHGCFNLFKNF